MNKVCPIFRIITFIYPLIGRIKIKHVVLFLLLLSPFACVEKYWPDLDNKYQNILVIDGMITSDPGPYYIKLSLATTVNYPELLPLSGYNISITDDAGTTEMLIEISPGIYSTSATGIRGIAGRKYKTQITSPNGKIYQSDFETLKSPVGIDSVYAEFEIHPNYSASFPTEGDQFYLNTRRGISDTNFYMWRLERSFEYKASFKIRYIYEGSLKPFPNSDSLETCWKTDKIMQIFTFNTIGMTDPVVTRFPLIYVTTNTRELSERYSLLVQQFTMSENAYTFWNSVREQNSTQDNLYTRQPFQIRGNVYNIDTPDEPVLGYFLVAGITNKRIFVDPPLPPVHFRYPICVLTEPDFQNVASIFLSKPNEWPIYLTTSNSGAIALPNQDCMDCQLSGGTIEKPDFWVDY